MGSGTGWILSLLVYRTEESFSFYCPEYRDALDLSSIGARTGRKTVLGLKGIKLGRPCYLQIEMSSENLENLGLGQGKRIWQTQ